MYRSLIKPIFFSFSAEGAHAIATFFLSLFSGPFTLPLFRIFMGHRSSGTYRCMGIDFPGRLGLAAGFDKDAKMFPALSALGFGFIEVGTVTPLAQPGNKKPRLFRLPKDNALINRMGFNNEGVKRMAVRLARRKGRVIIGGNIGRNKVTPNERAAQDYQVCFEVLFDRVDYFTVNVSSPNTPALRDLQEKAPLTSLLNSLQDLNRSKPNPKPILLKIAPDLNDTQLTDILDIVKDTGISGIIVANTTISRNGLKTDDTDLKKMGQGGLSGQPLKDRTLELVKYFSNGLGKGCVIVAAGGISSPADAREMIEAGADLLQVYTSFIYQGPSLIASINRELVDSHDLTRA